MRKSMAIVAVGALVTVSACTQEVQNQFGRAVQNWTGTDGILEIYAGDQLVRRFIEIDKLTSGKGTQDNGVRPYRYGYGVLDENLNGVADGDEREVYFEFSDYSTNYIFYSAP